MKRDVSPARFFPQARGRKPRDGVGTKFVRVLPPGAQADALDIEAQAKRRLADEYDAAQARGEVQQHGGQGKRDVPRENIPSVEDLGLTRKAIHDARQLRDAEAASPGLVRAIVDALVERAALEPAPLLHHQPIGCLEGPEAVWR